MMIDSLETFPKEDRTVVAHLCNRRFGIYADGLPFARVTIRKPDFKMVCLQPDGSKHQRKEDVCGFR
jgi:diaminopimelate epimerase